MTLSFHFDEWSQFMFTCGVIFICYCGLIANEAPCKLHPFVMHVYARICLIRVSALVTGKHFVRNVLTVSRTSLNLSNLVVALQIFPFSFMTLPSGHQKCYSCSAAVCSNHQELYHSNPFEVSSSNPQSLSGKSSFILRVCILWIFLPSSSLTESYSSSFIHIQNQHTSSIFLSMAFRFLPLFRALQ